jgi:hypothetical protein
MKNTVNLGSYRDLERTWTNLINANSKVKVQIELKYKGNTARPDAFDVKYWVDDSPIEIKKIIENN